MELSKAPGFSEAEEYAERKKKWLDKRLEGLVRNNRYRKGIKRPKKARLSDGQAVAWLARHHQKWRRSGKLSKRKAYDGQR